MAITARATIRTAAIPGTPGPSVNNTSELNLAFAGVPDVSVFSAFAGRSAGAPATYAGLTGAQPVSDGTADSAQFRFVGGLQQGTFEIQLAPMGGAVGDHVWVSVFSHAAAFVIANPATVPVLNLGPFVLGL